jgi:hypothetical protein
MLKLNDGGSKLEKKQPPGKRSVALPVTLLLLVMSVMGNVLLYTKNIEHTRGQSEEEGLAIFNSFEQAREELAYWGELAVQAADDEGLNRVTAGFLAESMDRSENGMRSLFVKASGQDKERFAEAPLAYEAFVSGQRETLSTLEASTGPLTASERSALESVRADFAELDAIISEFHFTGKDSSSVLIRLSGGHDWLDVIEKLLAALRK